MRYWLTVAILLITNGTAHALCVDPAKPLPVVALDNANNHAGQIIPGSGQQVLYLPWNSGSLTGKTHVIYHLAARHGVDDINDAFIRSLDDSLPTGSYQLVVILNIDDVFFGGAYIARHTFETNARKESNHVIFVLDDRSVIREHWCIRKQSSTVIVVDSRGTVLHAFDGKLNATDRAAMLDDIRREAAALPAAPPDSYLSQGSTP